MSGSKILITSGCSFSDMISVHIDTWPKWLNRKLGYSESHTGMGSQGNGLISRKIIYDIEKHAKTIPYEDMLVGIMWSGPTRSELYKPYANDIPTSINAKYDVIKNPTSVTGNEKWFVMNPWWDGYMYVNNYYELFDAPYLDIISYEHIIRTQDYLKSRGIKYFMTTYTSEVLDKNQLFEETTHLYNMIDFDNFLPIEGCYEWCRDNTSIPFPPDDNHPNSEQHRLFADNVIIPFLKEKKYV